MTGDSSQWFRSSLHVLTRAKLQTATKVVVGNACAQEAASDDLYPQNGVIFTDTIIIRMATHERWTYPQSSTGRAAYMCLRYVGQVGSSDAPIRPASTDTSRLPARSPHESYNSYCNIIWRSRSPRLSFVSITLCKYLLS